MTDLAMLASTAIAGAATSLVVSYIKDRLNRENSVVWYVSSSSGKREAITISKSGHDNTESAVQQLILKVMPALYGNTNNQNTEELTNLISTLQRYRLEMPLSRQLHIVLGNAYRALGDLQSAITLLSDYISRMTMADQRDHDLADAYYNRACFYVLSDRKELALADIKQSLDLCPENLTNALIDPDLAALRDTLEAMRRTNPA